MRNIIYKITNGMKTKAVQFLILSLVLIILVMPVTSFAQEGGLVPCGRSNDAGVVTNPCDFQDFMRLINNVVNFIFVYLALPIVALMSAYAGVSMVVSAGSPESRTKAKSILWDAIIGFLLAACSWLIIKSLLTIMGYKDTGLFF